METPGQCTWFPIRANFSSSSHKTWSAMSRWTRLSGLRTCTNRLRLGAKFLKDQALRTVCWSWQEGGREEVREEGRGEGRERGVGTLGAMTQLYSSLLILLLH